MNPRLAPSHRRSRNAFFAVSVLCVVSLCMAGSAEVAADFDPMQGFVANHGQWDPSTRYLAYADRVGLRAEVGGFALRLLAHSAVGPRSEIETCLRIGLEDEASQVEPVGQDVLPTLNHFFVGTDPNGWATHVPCYDRVVYPGIAAGVDLVLRNVDGNFEFDLIVGPCSTPGEIPFHCTGARSLTVDAAGGLAIDTDLGIVRISRPRAYRFEDDGARISLPCELRADGTTRFSIVPPSGNSDHPTVIDPGIEWSGFVGGTIPAPVISVGTPPSNEAFDLKVLESGAVLIAGYTGRVDFPTTPGSYNPTFSGVESNAFVSMLAGDGSHLEFSTFLGGSQNTDIVSAFEVGANGSIFLGGSTVSSDFPVTPGTFQSSNPGVQAVFATKLSADGSTLVYSAKLVSSPGGGVAGTQVTSSGEIVLTGNVGSANFPTTPGAFDTTLSTQTDGFVLKLNSSASALVFSTFLGGTGLDIPESCGLAPNGDVIVAGSTFSMNFPVTVGALQTTAPGSVFPLNGFVTRLHHSGASLVYSTYLGGNDNERLRSLEVDELGQATVAGDTFSPDFPTTPYVWMPTFTVLEGFISRLSPDGSSLIYSTFLGGPSIDTIYDIALDSTGAVTAYGTTFSGFFLATPGAYDETYDHAGSSYFIARLDPNARKLIYGSYLGGSAVDEPSASQARVDVDTTGAATVCGNSQSPDFPVTPGVFDTQFWSGKVFVTRFDMLPTGVTKFGSSTAGCAGPSWMSVNRWPAASSPDPFAITCAGAPPSTIGWLLFSPNKLAAPLSISGAGLWLDPARLTIAPAVSSMNGAAAVVLRLDGVPAGTTAHAQFLWPDSCASAGIAASNALEIVVQH